MFNYKYLHWVLKLNVIVASECVESNLIIFSALQDFLPLDSVTSSIFFVAFC